LRRADHSSRGVLPTVLRRCVWSRNIKNGCSIYIYDISHLRVKFETAKYFCTLGRLPRVVFGRLQCLWLHTIQTQIQTSVTFEMTKSLFGRSKMVRNLYLRKTVWRRLVVQQLHFCKLDAVHIFHLLLLATHGGTLRRIWIRHFLGTFGSTKIVPKWKYQQDAACNRIYYCKVYWRLNMFRATHRSSSGALNCICSLWFIHPCGDRSLSRQSLGNDRSPHGCINQRLHMQFRAPDDERCVPRNMLSLQ